jgi:hypothetical protein
MRRVRILIVTAMMVLATITLSQAASASVTQSDGIAGDSSTGIAHRSSLDRGSVPKDARGAFQPATTPPATPVDATDPDRTPVIIVATESADTPLEFTGEEGIDTRALMIAVAVGLLAAALIYGFWLLVRPKPGERADFGAPIERVDETDEVDEPSEEEKR